MKKLVPIAMSNRHIHLSPEDLETLFGANYELTPMKDLSQPGQYACEEKVDVSGPKGTIKGVRILGPTRPQTQLEISVSDSYALGIKPPVRDSGDIADSPGIKIDGPKGSVEIGQGAIVASRHIHMHTDDAKEFGLKDKDEVQVQVGGKRGLIFSNVLVRVSDKYALEMHVDVEEGNAAGVSNGQLVEIL
ncbi:phosphate propanoyltransferase [Alkalibacter rhizosphaerae]|uniref:Phosphate propanoyltransferase n=1 Tax=Alkalibacter rhizosphaerae TaxID=2815577 RepID=A0A974XHT3_9FIRM|nr:phosphate propanoyltransferase [Alkalibacter rhizosphaerae]QSX08930.1 phosphate propanoyltransferase [Alkalibacter rhizosphaerae]